MNASYESMGINASNKAAFNIGLLLKHGQLAEACKYYIDLVGDDDIDEAKSYVNSVYDMMGRCVAIRREDLRQLPSGVYLVRIGTSIVKKIVVL